MFLVRSVCGPLHIPLALHPAVGLLHAVPRNDFTRFPTVEDAEQAIRDDAGFKGQVASSALEIVSVAQHDIEMETQTRRPRTVGRECEA